MLGYSKVKHVLFELSPIIKEEVSSKIKVNSVMLHTYELTREHWLKLKQLQGRWQVLYLKWRYGSPETYIQLTFTEQDLVHVEWVVPASKMSLRFPFVKNDSYSIISCLTSRNYRGLGIYPSQIQHVLKLNKSGESFLIWTSSSNSASVKGIEKAGGTKIAEFVQKKWLFGTFSKIESFKKFGPER